MNTHLYRADSGDNEVEQVGNTGQPAYTVVVDNAEQMGNTGPPVHIVVVDNAEQVGNMGPPAHTAAVDKAKRALPHNTEGPASHDKERE